MDTVAVGQDHDARVAPARIFWRYLRLGCRAFGGPMAHIAYYRETLVARERWIDDATFARLLALCQFLPGPTSSQLGLLIAYQRGRLRGALCAWAGFTAPSFLIMTALAWARAATLAPQALVHGVKLAVVAVVADAVRGMAAKLCLGPVHVVIAGLAAAGTLLLHGPWVQVAVLAASALIGLAQPRAAPASLAAIPAVPSRALALGSLVLLVTVVGAALAVLALAASPWARVPAACARAGAFVFGGGHVVLPLLEQPFVGGHLLGADDFFAGYGAAQLLPGPLFTVAAFLGAGAQRDAGLAASAASAALATVAIFAPGILAALAALRGYARLQEHPRAVAAIAGVNAGTVGLLAAACWDPIATSAIRSGSHGDVALAMLAFAALAARAPSWLVVPATALAGWAMG